MSEWEKSDRTPSILVGDGVAGHRVLFWPLVNLSCLLIILTEIEVNGPQ